MHQIAVGDQVYSYTKHLFARVEEVFPAAVCVKVGLLSLQNRIDLSIDPQLWRADDIENLSVCRYCGSRDDLLVEYGTGIPFRICVHCRSKPSRPRTPPVG